MSKNLIILNEIKEIIFYTTIYINNILSMLCFF